MNASLSRGIKRNRYGVQVLVPKNHQEIGNRSEMGRTTLSQSGSVGQKATKDRTPKAAKQYPTSRQDSHRSRRWKQNKLELLCIGSQVAAFRVRWVSSHLRAVVMKA